MAAPGWNPGGSAACTSSRPPSGIGSRIRRTRGPGIDSSSREKTIAAIPVLDLRLPRLSQDHSGKVATDGWTSDHDPSEGERSMQHGSGVPSEIDGPGGSGSTFTTDTAGLPDVARPEVVRLKDGDRFAFRIGPVRKRLDDADLRMLAYNGSIPGPILHVDQGSEITVDVTNDGDIEATVHWHGLRLENRFDGVPHETQAPIAIGETSRTRCSSPTPASTGTTRISARTSGSRWASTARSSSNPRMPGTGLRSTATSPSRWTTCSSRTGTSPHSTRRVRTSPRWGGSGT